jgi:hypothetical protein
MSFEVVVRPVVFPNIRPAPARSLPPEDDPTKGFAVIRGNPGKQINLTFSTTISVSKSRKTETERRVDVARVYQKDKDDNVNKDNYVDINVVNKLKKKSGKDKELEYFKKIKEEPNIEVIEKNKLIKNYDVSGQ